MVQPADVYLRHRRRGVRRDAGGLVRGLLRWQGGGVGVDWTNGVGLAGRGRPHGGLRETMLLRWWQGKRLRKLWRRW